MVNTPFLVLSRFLAKTAMIHKEVVKCDSCIYLKASPKNKALQSVIFPKHMSFLFCSQGWEILDRKRRHVSFLQGWATTGGGTRRGTRWRRRILTSMFTLLGKGGGWNGFIREPHDLFTTVAQFTINIIMYGQVPLSRYSSFSTISSGLSRSYRY